MAGRKAVAWQRGGRAMCWGAGWLPLGPWSGGGRLGRRWGPRWGWGCIANH